MQIELLGTPRLVKPGHDVITDAVNAVGPGPVAEASC
jgi:hypothetical protein